jgi:hypothetical protein
MRRMEGRNVHFIEALRSMLVAAYLCFNHTTNSQTAGRRPILQHLLK